VVRDVRSLTEHAKFLNDKATFLLDAILGIINIEQTAIIKTFSVVSVALMPPTLIASIYGMNFKMMPELDWTIGYPLAVVAMIVSAVLHAHTGAVPLHVPAVAWHVHVDAAAAIGDSIAVHAVVTVHVPAPAVVPQAAGTVCRPPRSSHKPPAPCASPPPSPPPSASGSST
jgi:hypothetical protein